MRVKKEKKVKIDQFGHEAFLLFTINFKKGVRVRVPNNKRVLNKVVGLKFEAI